MARLALKSGHQFDICQDEIGLFAQNTNTIFRFQGQHDWEGVCDLAKGNLRTLVNIGVLLSIGNFN